MQNKSFPMNVNLCNVTTMTNYVDQSKHLRNSQTLLISTVQLHKPITTKCW